MYSLKAERANWDISDDFELEKSSVLHDIYNETARCSTFQWHCFNNIF